MMTAVHNTHNITKLLIAYHVDMNLMDEQKQNALMIAIEHKAKHVAEQLIAAGCDLRDKNMKGEDVSDICERVCLSTIQVLIDKKLHLAAKLEVEREEAQK